MKSLHIVLASASPRRAELLGRLGWKFDIVPSDVPEPVIEGESPSEMVMRLSELKGRAVASQYPDALVISSDTVVASGSRIFGKPENEEQALEMLSSLAGESHHVYSGLCLFLHGTVLCDFDKTEVTFRGATQEELKSYIATGEPFGKAGAYAIQGRGSLLVSRVHGDQSTVVGLPVNLLGRMMEKLGFSLSRLWEV